MAQQVKNPTAAARVAAEVQVGSLTWCSGLEDPALLWCRLQLRFGFEPWPGNFHMYVTGAAIKKKKNSLIYIIQTQLLYMRSELTFNYY